MSTLTEPVLFSLTGVFGCDIKAVHFSSRGDTQIMMSRKNYVRAIELMVESNPNNLEFKTLTSFLVKFFKENNPSFDEVKFRGVALQKIQQIKSS